MNQVLKKVVLASAAVCGLAGNVQAVGGWKSWEEYPPAGKAIVGVLGAGCVTLCVSSKARRATGRGIAWPFKVCAKGVSWVAPKIDAIQRQVLTTKTSMGKLSLLALTVAYLRAYGPPFLAEVLRSGSYQFTRKDLFDGDLRSIRIVFLRGLVGSDNFLRSPFDANWNVQTPFYREAVPSYILWAALGLTLWNNDRYDRDAKKAEIEAKKAPVVVTAAEKSE